MDLKSTWPYVLVAVPRDEAQLEFPLTSVLGQIHLLRRVAAAAVRHVRPRRRGLLQAPPLPLLRRRRSGLHQGHQHVPRIRAQEGGLCCGSRRGSSSSGGGGCRPCSGDRRREALGGYVRAG
uniref:Uncharacterized protein n=1 Tax=Leersia perrieri TaxID=77586 RepID=A0A0D9UY35_9ORYZ